jgi:hypothetical protein
LEATLLGDFFVATSKRDRLKRKERNLPGIVERETNDRAYLIVVNTVDQRGDENDLNACFVKVVNSSHLHVKEVTDLTVAVCVVADAIKLEIDITQSSFGSFPTELLALGELNPVGCRLHAVVTNFARVLDRFNEVRRDGRFTAEN